MKEEMMFFYPSQKDPDKVSLDVNLLKKLDVHALFEKILTMPQKFKYPQYSEKLGLAKFGYGARNITVFNNGTIKVQNCKDKEDAKFVLGELEALIR